MPIHAICNIPLNKPLAQVLEDLSALFPNVTYIESVGAGCLRRNFDRPPLLELSLYFDNQNCVWAAEVWCRATTAAVKQLSEDNSYTLALLDGIQAWLKTNAAVAISHKLHPEGVIESRLIDTSICPQGMQYAR